MKLTAAQKQERNRQDVENNAMLIDCRLRDFWLINRHKPIAVDYIVHADNARNIMVVAERLYERYTDKWFGGWDCVLDHKEDSKGYWTAARLVFVGVNHA